MGKEAPTSVRVVTAVAEAKGVDPASLEQPLYEVIDTDALDALVDHSGRGRFEGFGTLEFVYAGYAVAVTGAGEIRVRRSAYETNGGQSGKLVGQ